MPQREQQHEKAEVASLGTSEGMWEGAGQQEGYSVEGELQEGILGGAGLAAAKGPRDEADEQDVCSLGDGLQKGLLGGAGQAAVEGPRSRCSLLKRRLTAVRNSRWLRCCCS